MKDLDKNIQLHSLENEKSLETNAENDYLEYKIDCNIK